MFENLAMILQMEAMQYGREFDRKNYRKKEVTLLEREVSTMQLTSKSISDEAYLVYQFAEHDVIDSMSYGQITNNTIVGLLPATLTNMNNVKSIRYKITSRTSLEDFLQRPIKREQLLKLLSGIMKSVRSAQEYMIEQSKLLLDQKYIFLKVSTFDVQLMCLPVENCEFKNPNLQDFFWELVVKTPKDKSENRAYVSELSEKLYVQERLSLDDIEKILEEYSGSDGNVPVLKTGEVAAVSSGASAVTNGASAVTNGASAVTNADSGYVKRSNSGIMSRFFRPHKDSEKPSKAKKVKPVRDSNDWGDNGLEFDIPGNEPSLKVDFPPDPVSVKDKPRGDVPPIKDWGGTVVLPDNGNGTIADDSGNEDDPHNNKREVHLIRESNNEIIRISGTHFQLGRDSSYSDYAITNNKRVSETHAQIILHNNEYYIKDINSRNHTYVNGAIIPPMTEVPLSHGCKVCLGTENFTFKLY